MDPLDRAFLEERERRERVLAVGGDVIREARAVYAPASLSSPEPSAPPPVPSRAARLLARLDTPDRLVTYPLWVVWVAASHVTLLLLTCGVLVFGAAVLAVVVRTVVGFWPAALAAGSVSVLATAGTFVTVYQSFRTKLSQFPW